jgi:solute carrier family 25 (mitochondrial S-adenosylmethionine transporter), member 26
MSTAASLALPPRQTSEPSPIWRLAAAGGVAGALANCALFPLDTVKTVRQADPARFPGVLPAALGILRTRGPRGLYAGVAPALLGSALSSALYFGTYEFVRRRGGAAAVGVDNSPRAALLRRVPLNALSAACGNVVSSVLFVPKEVVKQRMQAGVDAGRFVGAAVGLVRADGLAGLYRGYKATLLRNIPSTMLRFALYEESKLLLMRSAHHGLWRRGHASRNTQSSPQISPSRPVKLSNWEHVGAGAVSGAIASALTTPMDVIKTRFATGKVPRGTGVVRAMADVVKDQGLGGLYVGIRPRVLWAALFAAIGFSSYEMCKEWFLPSTTAYDGVRPSPSARLSRLRMSSRYNSKANSRRIL